MDEPLPTVHLNPEAEIAVAPAAPAETDVGQWWRDDYGRWRLAAEVTAMRRFPDFRAEVSGDGLLTWSGRLESALPPGRSYLVRIAYPPCFPDEAPAVWIARPQLPEGVPHLLSGQRPCLYRGGYRDGYDPARTTAATLVAWTALWIHAFETWLATGEWPGEEA